MTKQETKKIIKALRGMSDILPEEIKFWRYLENIAQELFPLYGYKEMRLPLLEDTGVFVRSIGEDTEIVTKEMYTIKEREGSSISLRPEATASVVRAFLEHHLWRDGLIKKYYYLGPMFRRERPQSGRKRQFYQLGVEVIGPGSNSVFWDAEVISLVQEYLNYLQIKNFEIQLNHLGCQNCRKEFRAILKDYFKGCFKDLCPECQRRFSANPLRMLDCKKEGCLPLIKNAPEVCNSLCHHCKNHLAELQKILKESGVKFSLNPHLVRGLDYYTGVVFEVVHPGLGMQNALAAGGRYDDLIEEFGGPAIPATGFSFGLERIILALQKEKVEVRDLPKLEIWLVILGEKHYNEGFKILQKLRKAGISVDADFGTRSLKAQLRLANKIGVKLVLILGEEEKAQESIQVKNMETGRQELVKIEELTRFLKGLL